MCLKFEFRWEENLNDDISESKLQIQSTIVTPLFCDRDGESKTSNPTLLEGLPGTYDSKIQNRDAVNTQVITRKFSTPPPHL